MVASKEGHFVSCCYAKDFAAAILQHLVTVANLVLFLSSVLIKTLWPGDI
jgi:hypothetical protein